MDTKWYHYLLAFIAGGIFVNVVPHFVSGVTGQGFPSPFSDPPGIGLSSPVLNIVWAAINFVLAYAVVYFAKLNQRHASLQLGYCLGALAMALYLASYFGDLDL